jgi:hypothetical protein
MTNKFAEVTIIKNTVSDDIFTSISRYLGYETQTIDNDIIIIDFGDGSLCDTRDEYKDLKFKFAKQGHNHDFPIYFNKKIDASPTLFYKNPEINDKGQRNLKFYTLKNYTLCKGYKIDLSKYNMIYEDYIKKEIFSIVRIISNEEKPRFIVAYDDSILNRDDIIYLTDCIFKEKFT